MVSGYVIMGKKQFLVHCNPNQRVHNCAYLLCTDGFNYCTTTIHIHQYCLSITHDIEMYSNHVINGTRTSPLPCPTLSTTNDTHTIGVNMMFLSALLLGAITLLMLNEYVNCCQWVHTYLMDNEGNSPLHTIPFGTSMGIVPMCETKSREGTVVSGRVVIPMEMEQTVHII